MKRLSARPPGKGTKAITRARTKPSTRQPAVEAAAIHTVFHSALRKDSSRNTCVYAVSERPPVSGETDCRATRNSG